MMVSLLSAELCEGKVFSTFYMTYLIELRHFTCLLSLTEDEAKQLNVQSD